MSWTVEVDFKVSPVHGTGVFARRAIKAGTRIWQVDRTMRFEDQYSLGALAPRELRAALHGGYLHKPTGKFIWYDDGMQFMNHAQQPFANIGLGYWPALTEDHTIALRNIEAGEELFEDYGFWADGGIDPSHWLHRLYLQYCPEHFTFLSGIDFVKHAA